MAGAPLSARSLTLQSCEMNLPSSLMMTMKKRRKRWKQEESTRFQKNLVGISQHW